MTEDQAKYMRTVSRAEALRFFLGKEREVLRIWDDDSESVIEDVNDMHRALVDDSTEFAVERDQD